MKRLAAWILSMSPWSRHRRLLQLAKTMPGTGAATETTADALQKVAGTEPGWLRVFTSDQLLAVVRAEKAMDAMWRHSHQSREVWERDLLPAIHRYAAFVQLMPASEAHHHAHAGGLLSHTIEMVLAALT